MPDKVKTNAMRLLERMGIAYEPRQYQLGEEEFSGQAVARLVGMPPEQVFKTLVARGDRTGVMLACVPVADELDLKQLAEISGNKRAEMVPVKEIQALTGYVRGGVSPISTRRVYPVYVDESALQWPRIAVSAGIRGCQILLAPGDLLAATHAKTAPIRKPVPHG